MQIQESADMELFGGETRLPLQEEIDSSFLSARYDRLFKEIVASGWTNQSSGDVQAPSGYFTVFGLEAQGEGDRAEVRDMLAHHDSFGVSNQILLDELDPGWYLTRENEQGIISVWYNSSQARIVASYEALEKDYTEWLSQ